MKARPRYAENRIAVELNEIFVPLGYSPFMRQPVIGRTGPDLSINETGLVVDVKSRQTNPALYFAPSFTEDGERQLVQYYDHCVIPIKCLEMLKNDMPVRERIRQSKLVTNYLAHMHEWTMANLPDGISVIVLHKPNMPYGNALFIFYDSDIGKIRKLFHKGENK